MKDSSVDPHSIEVLSLRSYLTSGVAEFATCFGDLSDSADLLAELVVVLSNYQEEGIHLFPVVFICEDLSIILGTLRGQDAITVGSDRRSPSTIRTAFKQCGPLAENRQWAIFIEAKDGQLQYGVFRTDQSPLRPTPFERLRHFEDSSLKLVGVTRLGGGFVEVRTTGGKYRYIDTSGSQEEANNPPRIIHDFIKVVAKAAPDNLRGMLEAFYYQVGIELLHSSHGTLVAIISNSENLPSILSDGIMLQPKIQVIDGISQYLSLMDNDSYQRLMSWSQLLRKMMSMDGITVIDTSGSIVGYNCFIQNSILERKRIAWGGARRRAFDVLCSYLGRELSGVLYRSQDGIADFRTKSRWS